MASFDSPVYEPGDEGHTSYSTSVIDDNLHNMDPESPTHSDASTIEKKPNDIEDDDDDEHDYTYPDGVTGGTFDAPAPSSALIVAPKSEEVMMTEIVIPDNRMSSSIPDYYKPRSKSKPYKFYSKFHSTYVVCKFIGFVFLALVTIATCAVLILRVSVDHSFFDEEESTTAPMKEMTSKFTSSVSVLGVDGMIIVFTPALNDVESEEYRNVADAVTSSMDAIYSTGPLSSSYQGSEVTAIREGSVIVDVILTFISTSVITSDEVEVEIISELERNSNVLSDVMVDPTNVLVSDYNESPVPSKQPTVKPDDDSTVPPATTKEDVTASKTSTEKPSESPIVTENKETTEPSDSTTQKTTTTEKMEQSSEAPPPTTKDDVMTTTDKIEQSTTKQEVTTVTEKMEESTGAPSTTKPEDSTTPEKMEQSTGVPSSSTKPEDSTTPEKMEESTTPQTSTTKSEYTITTKIDEYSSSMEPTTPKSMETSPEKLTTTEIMATGDHIPQYTTPDKEETPTTTTDQTQTTCSGFEVRCKSGECIPFTLVGDGKDDCGDGSDEKFNDCSENPFLCTETMCVHPDFVCDGEDDCMNGKDEDGCM